MFIHIKGFNGLSEIDRDEYLNKDEERFLSVLYNHFPIWKKFGLKEDDIFTFYHGNVLTLAIDICDYHANSVLRSLRIDLFNDSFLAGEDETNQYVSLLNPNNADVKVIKKCDFTNDQFAEIAAQWISFELARKIELREWINESFHLREYVLVDSERIISTSCTNNLISQNNLGNPTKVKIIFPID